MPKVTRSRPRNSLATWNQTTRCLESEPEEMMTSQSTHRSGGTGSGLPGVLIHHPASPGRGERMSLQPTWEKEESNPRRRKGRAREDLARSWWNLHSLLRTPSKPSDTFLQLLHLRQRPLASCIPPPSGSPSFSICGSHHHPPPQQHGQQS